MARAAHLFFLLPLLGACSTYVQRTDAGFRAFQRGHLEGAAEAFSDEEKVGSAFLSGAEAGMIALAQGRWEEALGHLHRAAEAAADVEGRALAGPERLGETLASWAVNDSKRAYAGEGFERVYVHSALALSYLALGKMDDAGVEARLANQLLESEEKLYEKNYRAGGLGHLVSAIVYELRGERDHAAIDYERMVAKEVGTEIAGKALVRISEDLGREDDLARWSERFGAVEAPPDGAASVVVIAGVGLGPAKVEGRLVIPTKDGLLPIAAAELRRRPQQVQALRLVVAGSGDAVRTAVVEDVAGVAKENLSDRQLWSVTKSVGRGILKRQLTRKLEDEYGVGGRVAGDLFAFFSERADLRSWRTLPDSWQACRLHLPPGVHELALEALGGDSVRLGAFELEPGETMFILGRSIGPRLFAHPVGGRPVAAAGVPANVEGAAVPTSP